MSWWSRAERRLQELAGRVVRTGNDRYCSFSRFGRSRAAAELVADGEAFLCGHLAERMETRGRYVPSWAWTNLLAHGTEAELRSECSKTVWSGTATEGTWRGARAEMAADVLRCAAVRGSLLELQRTVLVPLELRLAARAGVDSWRPKRWARTVGRALSQGTGTDRCQPRGPGRDGPDGTV